jgi:hypothetical protein
MAFWFLVIWKEMARLLGHSSLIVLMLSMCVSPCFLRTSTIVYLHSTIFSFEEKPQFLMFFDVFLHTTWQWCSLNIWIFLEHSIKHVKHVPHLYEGNNTKSWSVINQIRPQKCEIWCFLGGFSLYPTKTIPITSGTSLLIFHTWDRESTLMHGDYLSNKSNKIPFMVRSHDRLVIISISISISILNGHQYRAVTLRASKARRFHVHLPQSHSSSSG